MIQDYELTPDKLRATVDPASLPFQTTAEIAEMREGFGQDRALAAIDFGCGIDQPGYNVFVSGPTGTGRNPTALARVKAAAERRPTPDDWAYVFNFDDGRRPIALRLPTGRGEEFADDIEELVSAIRQELPRTFESEAYEERKEEAIKEVQAERNRVLRELEQEARAAGLMLQPTPMGIVTLPIVEGHPMSREEFEQLPEESRRAIEERMEQFRGRIADVMSQARTLEKDMRRRVEELDRQEALGVIGHRFDDLKAKYQQWPQIVAYLDRMAEDIVTHQEDFRAAAEQAAQQQPHDEQRHHAQAAVPARYRVNLMVSHRDGQGAPVVQENSPTYYNLFGRLEYQPVAGGAVTDFTLIKPGATHRANGGFLILQVLDVLLSPFAWEALKRTMRSRQATIENIGEQYTPIPAAGLRPEPIPLDVKVVLVGSPLLYMLLYYYDEEFQKLFKVRADFDTDMQADFDATRAFADFLASTAQRNGLRPLDRTAVARMIEQGKRMAGDQERLSTRVTMLTDLMAEANFWASEMKSEVIRAEHVDSALEQKEYRSRMAQDRLYDFIARGDLRVDVEGSAVGQVNGLAVLDLGDYSFGRPSRITCRVTPGRAGVINVDREARLAGDIHSKAILILTGYIAGTYASKAPLSVSASLTFEQSYGVVEGDSASCAELYVILSALSGVPLRQDIALTGSVDQYGNVQPIGGANQKIEGFYATCKMKGLTGRQGVMLPAQNVKNLMLKPEVVEAVKAGQFHLWAVSHVEQGIEILTGVRAGTPDEPDSIHGKVAARLQEFTQALQGQRGPEERPTIIEIPPGVQAPPRPPVPPGPPPNPPVPPMRG